jgi:hypothetical protein
MNLLSNSVITNVLCFVVVLLVMLLVMLSLSKGLVKPLELWVLEPVSWICLLDSSPRLWEHTLVVVGKAVNFL